MQKLVEYINGSDEEQLVTHNGVTAVVPPHDTYRALADEGDTFAVEGAGLNLTGHVIAANGKQHSLALSPKKSTAK